MLVVLVPQRPVADPSLPPVLGHRAISRSDAAVTSFAEPIGTQSASCSICITYLSGSKSPQSVWAACAAFHVGLATLGCMTPDDQPGGGRDWDWGWMGGDAMDGDDIPNPMLP